MPWETWDGRNDRQYKDPEYQRNRRVALRRAGGRCEKCGHPHGRLQTDHVIPVSQGGGHDLANLMVVCAGPGSCKCHERKTAQEGKGYRKPGPRTARDPEPQPRTRWE